MSNSTCKIPADVSLIVGENVAAFQCLLAWKDYLRACDNCVDDELHDPAHLMEVFALGARFYATPFYRQHVAALQMAVLTTTGLWELSAEWEKCPELWKRLFADVLRHADVIFLHTLCLLCRDWDSAQKLARVFLAAGYVDHKDRYGLPYDQQPHPKE